MSNKYGDMLQKKISEDLRIFAERSFDLIDRVYFLLEQKGWTQRDLADKMGKRESEISKLLSGVHNITLKTLAKLEAAFGEPVIRIEGQSKSEKPLTIKEKIVEEVKALEEPGMLLRIQKFLQTLESPTQLIEGNAQAVLRFAGTLNDKEATAMQELITTEFGAIEGEW